MLLSGFVTRFWVGNQSDVRNREGTRRNRSDNANAATVLLIMIFQWRFIIIFLPIDRAVMRGVYYLEQISFVASCRLVYPVNSFQSVDCPHARQEVMKHSCEIK